MQTHVPEADATVSSPAESASAAGRGFIDSKHEGHRVYRVLGKDGVIQETTAEAIWRGGQMNMAWHVWRDQFQGVCDQVFAWSEVNKDRLTVSLVEVRSNKVVFFFVPKSETFDFEMSDLQAELAIELNSKGGVGYIETRQVPPWEVDCFVSRDALRVWPRE